MWHKEVVTHHSLQLHILPIIQRIRFKVCLVAFKIFNKFSPEYLQDHFPLFKPTTKINLRIRPGRDNHMFHTELDSKKETIFTKIKIEWNKLPLELRKEESVNIFKTKLKTLLFKEAFGHLD